MTANNTNNNNKLRDTNRFNDILATNLDATINDRYCQHCHLKLVHNPKNRVYDKYIYSCPRCNCGAVNIHNTEPQEKLIVTFPTNNTLTSQTNKRLIAQADNQRLSRSQYFINKRMQEKAKTEIEDPYLAILKRNNKITITNVDYNDPTDEDEGYY